jgi:predicted ArsR family transcriptional regulator
MDKIRSFTERQILEVLKAPEPQTVRDFAAVGLSRSHTLKHALMDLERDGLIVSRLEGASSPLRTYELVAQ